MERAPAAQQQHRRRALLLINPNSRRGAEAADAMPELLQAGGLDVRSETFSSPDEAAEGIRELKNEVDCIVVAGGDGTLNAVAAAVIETGRPMGIVPLGTANDLARTLGIPADLQGAADVIARGHTRRIDVGMANDQPFYNVASIGLSVELADQLGAETKKRWGRFGYAIAAIKVLTNARPFRAWIRSNGEEKRVRTLQIAVGNGRHYGGGMTVAADATADDGWLDLYSLEVDHWWRLLRLLPSLRRGTQGEWDDVRAFRMTEVTIRTSRPRPVNTDGELTTWTPAHFRIRPKSVLVYAPEDAR